MTQTHGTCDPKFEGVRAKFQELVESGAELGASLTVKIDGQDVVNLWGGFADAEKTRPWNEDTIVNVWSSTKTISALAILLLINDGQLSPNDKVAKYWPEFAANGKDAIQVRHLISHTDGMAVFEDPATMDDLCDFELSLSRIITQSPRWTPGTEIGYHTWTYGFTISELVRRRTGLALPEFVAQRIAGPLGADFQIGAKEADWPRIAELVPPPPFVPPSLEQMPPPDSIAAKMLNPLPDATFAHTPAWRRADIGAANGHGNGRSLATIWANALTVSDDDDDKRLLSKETVDLVFQEQIYSKDLSTGMTARFGVGMGLRGNGDAVTDAWMPKRRICFWGGWGGSMVINDLDSRMTIGYAMNRMERGTAGNSAVKAYVAEIYKALGVSIP